MLHAGPRLRPNLCLPWQLHGGMGSSRLPLLSHGCEPVPVLIPSAALSAHEPHLSQLWPCQPQIPPTTVPCKSSICQTQRIDMPQHSSAPTCTLQAAHERSDSASDIPAAQPRPTASSPRPLRIPGSAFTAAPAPFLASAWLVPCSCSGVGHAAG